MHNRICGHVSSEPFRMSNFNNLYSHITNYRINHNHPSFNPKENILDYCELCKKLGNEKNGYDYWYNNLLDKLRKKICEILSYTINNKKYFFSIPNTFEVLFLYSDIWI